MKEAERPKIGLRYCVGHLLVAERTRERHNIYSVWLCKCDCGEKILLDTRCLQCGTITDCGCISKIKPGQKDVTGQRFGKLVAL